MKTLHWNRLMMGAAVLFFVLCLSAAYVDARGRGGFGGGRGGFRGGRGGFGGGSVRQARRFEPSSARSRDISRQPSRSSKGHYDYGSVRHSSREPGSRRASGGRYESFGRRDSVSRQPSADGRRYTNADLKRADKTGRQDRFRRDTSRLNDEQKSKLRKKYANSGLTPEQLPRDPERDPEERREDWQEWRDERREDWQKWYDDKYDDYWDDYYGYAPWWYGYPVSTVSYSYYINDSQPCKTSVVADEGGDKNTYYYCDSTWYQPVSSSSGETKYVVTTPPARAEVTSLSNARELTVDGKTYYVSSHVFYQKIKRDGRDVYVTVDAPVGARVATIPEYAVEVQYKGTSYFRFGQTFYKKQGDGFVIVKNPGI